jgi:hypothetical protein
MLTGSSIPPSACSAVVMATGRRRSRR